MSAPGALKVRDALEAAGIRTATRPGDVTTPCCYLWTLSVSNDGVPLVGGTLTGVGLAWIPIRGMADLERDATDLDAVVAAVEPLVVSTLTLSLSTVQVGDVAWPAWSGTAEVL